MWTRICAISTILIYFHTITVTNCNPIGLQSNQLLNGVNNCAANQTFAHCGRECEPKCGALEKLKEFCPLPCEVAACKCIKGYARRGDNTCVKLVDCPSSPVCPLHAHFADCPSTAPYCERSCRRQSEMRPNWCAIGCGTPRCVCDGGFVWNDGKTECLRPAHCVFDGEGEQRHTYRNKRMICWPNEYNDVCGPATANCERSCAKKIVGEGCEHEQCSDRCLCVEGYVRGENKECVPEGECSDVGPTSEAIVEKLKTDLPPHRMEGEGEDVEGSGDGATVEEGEGVQPEEQTAPLQPTVGSNEASEGEVEAAEGEATDASVKADEPIAQPEETESETDEVEESEDVLKYEELGTEEDTETVAEPEAESEESSIDGGQAAEAEVGDEEEAAPTDDAVVEEVEEEDEEGVNAESIEAQAEVDSAVVESDSSSAEGETESEESADAAAEVSDDPEDMTEATSVVSDESVDEDETVGEATADVEAESTAEDETKPDSEAEYDNVDPYDEDVYDVEGGKENKDYKPMSTDGALAESTEAFDELPETTTLVFDEKASDADPPIDPDMGEDRTTVDGHIESTTTVYPTCGENEQYLECSSCESSCEDGDPSKMVCLAVCQPPKCQCIADHVRHEGACVSYTSCNLNVTYNDVTVLKQGEGDLDGELDGDLDGDIELQPMNDQATTQHYSSAAQSTECPPNERWRKCANQCERTCGGANPMCIASCQPARCQCREGFVRHGGHCIGPSDCPPNGAQRDLNACSLVMFFAATLALRMSFNP